MEEVFLDIARDRRAAHVEPAASPHSAAGGDAP
jgi:hypothetical protein